MADTAGEPWGWRRAPSNHLHTFTTLAKSKLFIDFFVQVAIDIIGPAMRARPQNKIVFTSTVVLVMRHDLLSRNREDLHDDGHAEERF
jgi:hypothetical protein